MRARDIAETSPASGGSGIQTWWYIQSFWHS